MAESNNERVVMIDKEFKIGWNNTVNASELIRLLRNKKNRDQLVNVIRQISIYDAADAMQFLLDNGYKIEVLEPDDEEIMGRTAIHIAMYDGCDKIPMIDSIFQQCVKDLNYIDDIGLSHLHIACAIGNLTAVKNLLKIGSDINARCQFLHAGKEFSPLLCAASWEQAEIIDYLIQQGADVEAIDDSGHNALHLACMGYEYWIDMDSCADQLIKLRTEKVKAIDILVRHKKLINAKDNCGLTPVLYLLKDYLVDSYDRSMERENCRYKIIRRILREIRQRKINKLIILLDNGAKIDAKCANGDTVLHLAISYLKPTRCPKNDTMTYFDDKPTADMVEILLKSGADLDAKNDRQQTPLQLAVSLLNASVVAILLKYGANVENVQLNYKSSDCFIYAEQRPCLDAVENLLEILELLIKAGWPCTLKDNLAVLEFLVRRGNKCYLYMNHFKPAELKLAHFVCYGDKEEIDWMEDTYWTWNEKNYDETHKYFFKALVSQMKSINFPNERVLECNLENSELENGFYNIQLELMKKVQICDKVSLFHLLTMCPARTYFYIKDKKYQLIVKDDDFEKKFRWGGELLKGHITKSLTRRYILKSAIDYFSFLIPVDIPDMCCEMILDHLSNKAILNVCIAAVEER